MSQPVIRVNYAKFHTAEEMADMVLRFVCAYQQMMS